MAKFCDQCGKQIGLFSGTTMVNEDGYKIPVCKPCKIAHLQEQFDNRQMDDTIKASSNKDFSQQNDDNSSLEIKQEFQLKEAELHFTLHIEKSERIIYGNNTKLTIGRTDSNSIRIMEATVNRNHAQIITSSKKSILVDLKSSNGTFLNGEKVRGPVILNEGDAITIGSITMIYRLP